MTWKERVIYAATESSTVNEPLFERVFAALPTEQQSLLELYFRDGKSMPEVAKSLGLDSKAASSLLRKTLRAFSSPHLARPVTGTGTTYISCGEYLDSAGIKRIKASALPSLEEAVDAINRRGGLLFAWVDVMENGVRRETVKLKLVDGEWR